MTRNPNASNQIASESGSRCAYFTLALVTLVATMMSCTSAAEDGTLKDEDPEVANVEEDTHVSDDKLESEDNPEFDVVRFDDIRKSERDKRSYRGLILSNELRVVLISDPETDMAAASMTVNCGYMHDIEEVPGLAHFLEHMLFMGSVKYPDVNHYEKFIAEHAGRQNGHTGESEQGYYFDVSSANLAETLDIMAQMFLEPLMEPSATARELNAIDSEMDMLSVKDNFPLYQLRRSLSRPGHSHAKFNIGNKKSLETDPQSKGVDVLAKLREMHTEFYSSKIMYLAVLGKESLHDLEKMVVPLFEKIENKEVPSSVYPEHPWGPEQLNRKVYFVPKTDVRTLIISFPVPSPQKYYKNVPLRYLGHLLGHEGQGSLLVELRERNLIESLNSGYDELPGFAYFDISMDLTEKALDRVDEIVKLVFQYIYLLRTDGVQKRLFDELKQTSEQGFTFKATSHPYSYVQNISAALNMGYPFEDVLSYYVASQWNGSVVKGFLDHLIPENMNILIGSKSFEKEADLKEPWFDTKYSIQMISEDLINETWKITQPCDKFHVPHPNEFISENFDLYPLETNEIAEEANKESKFPRIVHESKISRFWFKQDDEFKLPKFFVRFNISSPITCSKPKNLALNALFADLFIEMFSTRAGYSASLVGLNWSLTSITCALQVTLSGYTEKLPYFIKIFLNEMMNFKVDEEKFDIQLEALNRIFKNFDNEQPYSHALLYLEDFLFSKGFTKLQVHAIVQTLKMDDMRELTKQIFSRVFVEGFIYGNCDEELAKDVVNTIEGTFAEKSVVLAEEIVFTRVVELEDGLNFMYESSHKRSASSSYVGYFQVGSCDYPDKRNIVLTDLFAQIAGEKCFKTLRTDEQLGYVVKCCNRSDNDAKSFMIVVQSSKHPAYVHSRVEAFLRDLHQKLIEMSQEEFETNKTSLKDKYLEKVLGQRQRFDNLWNEITFRRYDFERDETNASLLESLKKENIIEFFETYIDESSSRRKKIDIYVTSEITKPSLPDERPTKNESSVIENAVDFKRDRSTFVQMFRYMEVDPPGISSSSVHLHAVQ